MLLSILTCRNQSTCMCYFTASEDCDTHSVTALACKSLNLSQALHEKCLHLELSSSDEDDTLRNLQVNPLYLHLTLETNQQLNKIPRRRLYIGTRMDKD